MMCMLPFENQNQDGSRNGSVEIPLRRGISVAS